MVITILIMGIMAVTVDGISDGIFHKDTLLNNPKYNSKTKEAVVRSLLLLFCLTFKFLLFFFCFFIFIHNLICTIVCIFEIFIGIR